MSEVLIIGGGGREHELGRAISLSAEVEKVYFGPGNAGTELLPKGENTDIDPADFTTDIFVVIGPEAPLVDGLADDLRTKGCTVFGPSAQAAQLEGSKSFAAEFMNENSIPQPPYFEATGPKEARDFLKYRDPSSCVLKADEIAGGKGVILPTTIFEAEEAIDELFAGGYGGGGKNKLLFQKRFHGPEVSVFVVSDGEDFVILPFAQDHKRLNDGDKGPNTGGMGAYASAHSLLCDDQIEKIFGIAEKSITGMKKRGTPYQGVMYLGHMMAQERGEDPVVLEYNCRFGDPEAQILLPIMERNGIDVYRLFHSAAEGKLGEKFPSTLMYQLGGAALTVCLAADGYPVNPKKGKVIYGLDKDYKDVIIHHGGTKRVGDDIVTAGGRVLYVTGLGETIDEAAVRAYQAIGVKAVHFDGMQYRTDIGYQMRQRSIQQSR